MKSSILGGALLLTATNLLLRLISIGFNVFLSYRIGAEGLGLLQLIGTIGAFALLLGTSGIRTSAMYLAAEEFGHRRTGGVKQAMRVCLRYGLLVSTVAGLGLMLFSGRIASALLRDERAALSLWGMGLLLPFSCLCGIMTGYYTACGRIRQLVGIEIAERLVSVALTLLLLLRWTDARRACCAITLGSSLGCVFDFFLLYARYRRDVRHVHASREAMTPRLLRLCVPLALNDYLRAGLTTAEQLLIPYGLSRWGGSSARALADYGTIHAMVFPILMFPAALLYALADLLVPELSRCLAMGRTLRVRDLAGKCLRLTMLFSCLVAGFLFVNADALGTLIYHSADAGRYLRIFAPMILMLYLDAITDGMLKGLAEQLSCVRYNTLTSALDVVLLFLLLPRYGVAGYVFTFTLTHAINLFLSVRRLLRVVGLRLLLWQLLKPVFCLLPCLFVTSLLPHPTQPVLALALRSVYFLAVLCALYCLSDVCTDRPWLRRVIRRSIGGKRTMTRAAEGGLR